MGFRFRGVYSNSFKWLGVGIIHNEISPEPKTITVENDFIDGNYDFRL